MNTKTSNTIQLGLFVTIGLLLFITGVYFIGSRQNLFGSTFHLYSIFHNINGLQPGNNVRYSGINVGTVKKIVLLNDTTVRVEMEIDSKVQPFIRKDVIASIGSDGLVGSMLVNISPGEGKKSSVEDGDLIESYSRIETEALLNTLGKTNENIAMISYEMLRITQAINEGQGTLSLLLRDSLLASDMRGTMANLDRTTENLVAGSNQIRQILADVQAGKGTLGYLLQDSTFAVELNASARQVDTLISNRLTPFIADLQESARQISAASTALNNMVQESTADTRGPINLLLRDTAATAELQQILHNLNEGTARFSENMEAMKHNFLFRKYFKRKEKENEP